MNYLLDDICVATDNCLSLQKWIGVSPVGWGPSDELGSRFLA